MRIVTTEVNENTVKFIRQLSPPRPRYETPSQERIVSVTMMKSEIPENDIETMQNRFQADWLVTAKEIGLPVDIED